MKQKINRYPVDIVIIWVDGSDKVWLAEKNKYLEQQLSQSEIDATGNRYRDWENLQYLFRGIEQFMPWVNRVHFVTNGQKPDWLNTKYSKLNWVKHSDYIPKEYLPTFSSHPIELNLHRIKGLSENFIFFNDDMFVTSPMKLTDFFKKGLPCDQVSLWRALATKYDDPMPHIMLNNNAIINQNFSLGATLKNNFSKWFSLHNGIINLLLTVTLAPFSRGKFPAMYYHHMPQPYLKSTFEAVWRAEPSILGSICSNRFRSPRDLSQMVMKNWQIASGNFMPKNIRRMSCYSNGSDLQLLKLADGIKRYRYKLVCNNDAEVNNFDNAKVLVNTALATILPKKSQFEL